MSPVSFERNTMKKPILAALGLAGACVACCSVPIAVTLLSGLPAAGLAGWLLGKWTGPLIAAVLAALIVGGAWPWKVRRRNAGCGTNYAPACSIDQARCGCGSKSRRSWGMFALAIKGSFGQGANGCFGPKADFASASLGARFQTAKGGPDSKPKCFRSLPG